ncbi:recombination protein RecR [candidate division WWE3 bacterium CG10_big_fil_rev_8_21_14_0_10_32_10]|uniref:Recombination protein RecR n=1 Tax=candidate division WWE3 bacterium CG10_big_fil_rev_8_21_14_0_10_32_10 TaxID=1975090 RepID=A0A2H0R9B1_UNCKA|nr:MAG: recombination protein RecR [candidate division WWE3 bacterium CG10_big_fil_rev_8_21_14_0_10_32_10]
MQLPKSLQQLIEHFEELPGIGTKTAERLAFYFLKVDFLKAQSFANSLIEVKKNLRLCTVCGNVAEGDLCDVCKDISRKKDTICVVENVLNLIAIEKTGYEGLYHVLHGVLNPLNGVNVEDLNINTLFNRLRDLSLKTSNSDSAEIILATNPTMEGESTAMYIKRKIEQENLLNIKITRIGRGIPTGGDIEFADKTTIDNALQGRKEF